MDRPIGDERTRSTRPGEVDDSYSDSTFDWYPDVGDYPDDSDWDVSEADKTYDADGTPEGGAVVVDSEIGLDGCAMPFAALGWSMSFSGCGFLCIYHLGVVHSLAEHGRKLLLNVHRYGGASAGSLIAAAIVILGLDRDTLQKCTRFCYELAETARSRRLGVLSPTMSLLEPIRTFLDDILPEDAHLLATNRLFVSITELRTNTNRLISDFHSRQHLINCLLASSLIPYLTGKEVIRLESKCFIDGGMTDNLPEIPGSRTILVAPFSGRQHICPRDQVGRGRFVRIHGEEFQMNVNNMKRGWHAFFPPDPGDLGSYFDQGRNDCIRFLKREHLYEDSPQMASGSLAGEFGHLP